jgi:AcrR family transcriptional regulator
MRERILEVGLRLFVGRGYDGISMREIADACGLSKAGLYYHFKDKEDLFLAILEDSLNELEQLTGLAAQHPGGARAQITHFVELLFTQLPAERREVIRLASQDMIKVSPDRRAVFNLQYQQRFLGQVAGLLRGGVERGELRAIDPDLAVWGLLGIMYPFFNPAHTRTGSDARRVIDFVLMVFLEGVTPRD